MKMLRFIILGLVAVNFAACVDLNFDEPPSGGEPVNITPNATLQQLRSYYQPGAFTVIPDSLVIRAVVVADDRSGNFYKTLIIQDETAGIELKVNSIGLFNQFPIGRELFIYCKGLVISDYSGLIQLGGGTYLDNGQSRLAGIEETLIKQYLVAGKRDQTHAPRLKKINELTPADHSMLVQLDVVEFDATSAGQPYADAVNQASINRTVKDCDKQTIILRSSGFASFASVNTPSGKGSLTAIVGTFGGALQLFIRDTSDVAFTDPRCGQGGTNGFDSLTEGFESVSNQQDVLLEGWINQPTKGTRLWRGRYFDNNTYVQATAFGDNAAEMESWLITPALNLSTPKTLTFRSAVAFYTHAGGEVLLSTNFDGINIHTATWTPLSATLAGAGDPNYAWVNSGTIDLSGFSGKGYIAFRYTGSGPGGQTSTFIIDDVVVKNK